MEKRKFTLVFDKDTTDEEIKTEIKRISDRLFDNEGFLLIPKNIQRQKQSSLQLDEQIYIKLKFIRPKGSQFEDRQTLITRYGARDYTEKELLEEASKSFNNGGYTIFSHYFIVDTKEQKNHQIRFIIYKTSAENEPQDLAQYF